MRRLLYGWAALTGAWVFSLAMYPRLPERVATHWNVKLEADAYSPKLWVAVIIPTIVVFGAPLAAMLLSRIDPRRDERQSDQSTYWTMWSALLALLALIQVFIVGVGAGWGLDPSKALPLILGVLFIVLGNITPRLRPNWFMGIRTPWTLSSDQVWRRTHRLGGMTMMLGGILLVIIGLQPSDSVRSIGWIAVVAVEAAIPIAYSYIAWRRLGRPPRMSNA